jgi:hypothetical protein
MAWSVAFREQVACNNSGIVLRLEFKAVLSALGQKQTLKRFQPMAALFPKADMPQIEALEPDRSKK